MQTSNETEFAKKVAVVVYRLAASREEPPGREHERRRLQRELGHLLGEEPAARFCRALFARRFHCIGCRDEVHAAEQLCPACSGAMTEAITLSE